MAISSDVWAIWSGGGAGWIDGRAIWRSGSLRVLPRRSGFRGVRGAPG